MAEFQVITPLRDNSVEALNRLVTQLNEAYTRLGISLAQAMGQDGMTPTISNDMDLSGKRITNAGRAVDENDYITVRDARDFALFARPGEKHVTNTQIVAEGGIVVPSVPTTFQDAINMQTAQSLVALQDATAAPPAVADASDIGTSNGHYAREQHTHRGVNYDAGTFTITGTGFTVNPTGTARWEKHRNIVVLFIPQLTGTSNATSFTLTGLPAAITPTLLSHGIVLGQDNSTSQAIILRLNNASTTIDLFTITPGTWTAAGTKRIEAVQITYGLI